jgi:hypothetical protein
VKRLLATIQGAAVRMGGIRGGLLPLATVVFTLQTACGGNGTPVPPPTPTPVPPVAPANALPVIDAVSVHGNRAQEPANFADAGESVSVVAKVHDEETAVDQLQYTWTATAGTFSGTGTSVTWTAPSSVDAPGDVTIHLKVTEKYGTAGAFEHSVEGSTTLSMHDSPREVAGMARQFLLDFSDSSVPVDVVMRNFDMTCGPAIDERDQVARNRATFHIERYNIGSATATVPFGNAFCPVPPGRIQRGDACSAVPSHWESTVLSSRHKQIADGVDYVSAYYHADLKAWKLCDSQFPGTCVDATAGAPCSDALASAFARGLAGR